MKDAALLMQHLLSLWIYDGGNGSYVGLAGYKGGGGKAGGEGLGSAVEGADMGRGDDRRGDGEWRERERQREGKNWVREAERIRPECVVGVVAVNKKSTDMSVTRYSC